MFTHPKINSASPKAIFMFGRYRAGVSASVLLSRGLCQRYILNNVVHGPCFQILRIILWFVEVDLCPQCAWAHNCWQKPHSIRKGGCKLSLNNHLPRWVYKEAQRMKIMHQSFAVSSMSPERSIKMLEKTKELHVIETGFFVFSN